MSDPSEGVRLQVFMAHAGVASRRACERIILDGRVTINGNVASELGVRVSDGDRVELDGRLVGIEGRKRYILLNKPAGYISAMQDPEGRPLAVSLIRGVEERVYNVGRLDQWSSGLLLFTNDGELAFLLGHPSGGIEKEYLVVADSPLGDDFFLALRDGLEIDGVTYRAHSALRSGPDSARITLVEGKNREIRRVLEHFDKRPRILRRIRIGNLSIGEMGEGSFRDLSEAEVEGLRSHGRGKI
jgi:23S rRNA pseudouridine2605 synthase